MSFSSVTLLLLIPAAAALLIAVLPGSKLSAYLNAGASFLTFLAALSLAGAIFMIEELNRPLEGFLKISGAPIQYALSHMGQ